MPHGCTWVDEEIGIHKNTEENIVFTPSIYRPVNLKSKLDKLLERKILCIWRIRSDDTSIFVSVNNCF